MALTLRLREVLETVRQNSTKILKWVQSNHIHRSTRSDTDKAGGCSLRKTVMVL